jgi:hypothetical protein
VLDFIGTTFPRNSQWYEDEINAIETIKSQIDQRFPNEKNLFINTTWFGPQFKHNIGQYEKFLELCPNKTYDNLFLLAAADPIFLADYQIAEVHEISGNGNLYLLGHFDSPHNFNFYSMILPKYFKPYSNQELKMLDVKYTFINYNRKPRIHRSQLVERLVNAGLDRHGIVTHGIDSDDVHKFNENGYAHSITLKETVEEIGEENQWWPEKYNIPHDIHSLGRMNLWRHHFLNVVGETENKNDVPTFVSEKTWKPIIGLRPFIINGQSKVYQWLRDRGFRTFNQYWKHIPVETDAETPAVCATVVEYLCGKSKQDIQEMYNDMLPDLIHNQQRFYEFGKEQKYKMENIF